MTNQPVYYPLPEGRFLTLPPDADFTINILKFTDSLGTPYKVIINRTELTEGQTIDEYYALQQERMR